MANEWDALTDSIVGRIKERAKKFIEDNKELEDFVKERSEAVAKTLYRLHTASEGERPALERDLKVIRQTMENKLAAVALKGQREQQKIFREIFFAVINTLVEVGPQLRKIFSSLDRG